MAMVRAVPKTAQNLFETLVTLKDNWDRVKRCELTAGNSRIEVDLDYWANLAHSDFFLPIREDARDQAPHIVEGLLYRITTKQPLDMLDAQALFEIIEQPAN